MKNTRLKAIKDIDAMCPEDLEAAGFGVVYDHRRELLAEVTRLRRITASIPYEEWMSDNEDLTERNEKLHEEVVLWRERFRMMRNRAIDHAWQCKMWDEELLEDG